MRTKDLILLGAGYAAGRYMKRRSTGSLVGIGSPCSDAGRALANCRYAKKKSGGKVKVSKVVIHWSEMKGVPEGKTFKTINQANEYLKKVFVKNYGSRGERFDSGYDKTSFSVYYKDDSSYGGRLDLSLRSDNPLKPNLIQDHIKDYFNYLLTEDPTVTEKYKQEIKDFLKTYEL